MFVEIWNNKKKAVKLTVTYNDASDTLKVFLAEKPPNPIPGYVTKYEVKIAANSFWAIHGD